MAAPAVAVSDPANPPLHRGEAGKGDERVGKWIGAMAILPRGDQDQLRFELIRHRLDDPLERSQIECVTRTWRQRDVDVRSFAGPVSDIRMPTDTWVERPLVQRYKEHG